jgi:alanine-glyoxylate transaminase/serine-glyoxylate transaminase/serine-pyruvate transaminase
MPFDPSSYRDIDPGKRVLMGPGPSDVPARVLQAMSAPCIGHLDPAFLAIMNETQELLRHLMQTSNAMTIPVSGTGSAGMEATFVNLVEPGDRVAICVNGVFGMRMCDLASRIGAEVIRIDSPWGRAVDPEGVKEALKGVEPKLLAVVHAETSTGACSDINALSQVARDKNALFLVDMVTSLGGMEVGVDQTGIDAAYSGTQKCLSCPPGLSPVTFSDKAVEVIQSRKHPVSSWYLDMNMVGNYWGTDRKYHHTAPINMIYALREALRIIAEEGLQARWQRHALNHQALVAGLEAMGLSLVVPEDERLPMLNAVKIPEGANDAATRSTLLKSYDIEIGGGLGDFAGKVWRVGLMGHAACQRNVLLFLSALETTLASQGVKVAPGALKAAAQVYDRRP